MWSAVCSMRALIRAEFLPSVETSSAAVPVTCGAAMLVPCAPTIKMGNGAQLISTRLAARRPHEDVARRGGRGDIDSGSEVGVVGEGIGGGEGTIRHGTPRKKKGTGKLLPHAEAREHA